jgi:hypothetical protein
MQCTKGLLTATAASMLSKGTSSPKSDHDLLILIHQSRIRYAAPPLGKLRFAAPQAPAKNKTSTITADKYPPICPQTGGSIEVPAAYGFTSALGDEDCLFLNVFAPANAKNLPIFFWIRKYPHPAGLFMRTNIIQMVEGMGFSVQPA